MQEYTNMTNSNYGVFNIVLSTFGLYILFTIAYLIIIPYLTIWAVNLLFSTSLILTFDTWCAIIVLVFLVPAKPSFKLTLRDKSD